MSFDPDVLLLWWEHIYKHRKANMDDTYKMQVMKNTVQLKTKVWKTWNLNWNREWQACYA